MPLAGWLLQWCAANDTAIKATDTVHVGRVKVKTAYKPLPENNRVVRLWRWSSHCPSPLLTQNLLLLLLHFSSPSVFWLVLFLVLIFLLCFLAERFMVAPLLYEAWAFPFRLAFCRSHSLSSHRTISFCNSFHQSLSLCISIEIICLFAVYAKAHDNKVSQYTHKLSLTQPHIVRLWIAMWTVMTVTALQDSQGPTAMHLPLMSMLTARVYNGIR